MKAKLQPLSMGLSLLGFALLAGMAGCQQPYSYSPYGPPYQPAPYGAPAYGQPMAPGNSGTVAPGSGTVSPPISSVPSENKLTPKSGSGNNAPKFNPKNPDSGKSVPDPSGGPNSPYFEQSSSRVPMNTFSPATASSGVSQAGFARTASQDQVGSVKTEEQSANFELPSRPAIKPTASANPFAVSQDAKPINSDIPLAPPRAEKKTAATSNSLEGTVRKVSENDDWVLEFASSKDPFGGRLQLTGTPEVLKLLQDGRRYRLQGYIESQAANSAQNRFHIEHAQPLGSSFAPTK